MTVVDDDRSDVLTAASVDCVAASGRATRALAPVGMDRAAAEESPVSATDCELVAEWVAVTFDENLWENPKPTPNAVPSATAVMSSRLRFERNGAE